VLGSDWQSFIAIDDLQFVNCGYGDDDEVTCHSDEFRCKDKKSCVKFKYACDDHGKDCSDGSDEESCALRGCDCDFGYEWEKGQCGGWKQELSFADTDTEFGDWVRDSWKNYLYVKTDVMMPGDTAAIETPLLPPTHEQHHHDFCYVRFKYLMDGGDSENVGLLDVNMVIPSTGQRHLLFRQSGNHGDEWHHANILINANANYTIEFEALKGRARGQVIAIDSVHFTRDCYEQHTPSNHTFVCPKDHFACVQSKQCIPQHWRCDLTADCVEGEDESGCFTTTPPPQPPTTTPRQDKPPQGVNCSIETEFECADHECLPSRLQCDGVKDCANGEDEHAFCLVDGEECDFVKNEVYCGLPGGDVLCLANKSVCDNVTDCQQGQDESLCLGCPSNHSYCLNAGTCNFELNWGPVCTCRDGFEGHRCQTKKPDLGDTAALLKGLLPIMALVLLALIIGGCYWKKKRTTGKSMKAVHFSRDAAGNGIENPAYGMQMKDYGGTATITDSDLDNNNMQPINYNMATDPQATKEVSDESTAISNPLFRELY